MSLTHRRVFVKSLRVDAAIGVYDHEHGRMQPLVIDATFDLTLHDIQHLREANNVSQPVFARYLNTSESTVEKWETGAKRPSAMARKLLAIVQKHGLQVLA